MTTGNDKVEETVWEYKALILDRDKKPKGPHTWVSKPASFIKVQESDPDLQYEACEFGNGSSRNVAFRITKANGLQFNPDHGVLKPNEKVPLKFKVRPSTRRPDQAQIEILAIHVNPTNSDKAIEDKWRLVPANKVSRVRHTVQLRAPEITRPQPLPPPPAVARVTLPERTSRHAEDRHAEDRHADEKEADRPAVPTVDWSERWRSEARPQPQDVPPERVVPARQEASSSCTVMHVTVALLALAVFGLMVQVYRLWIRVDNIGENFCNRHYCIWFFCRACRCCSTPHWWPPWWRFPAPGQRCSRNASWPANFSMCTVFPKTRYRSGCASPSMRASSTAAQSVT
ncbi:uncharacterized protein [Dermacentor andersoni]|uniref:uncharacterized protein isoform X2 n=1 Tax=Dermacentor andersoni TaxID=34620 RepID=UPI0024170556|nr:uncharacterized protein LOC126543283 isoform X2 [Dermacentor andersoni]